LLLLLLLLAFPFLSAVKFHLITHAALSVTFFSLGPATFLGQLCFFGHRRIDP
jgi:hypothetical protein